MKLTILRCPLCKAQFDDMPDKDARCGQMIYKCSYCRGNTLITFTQDEEGLDVVDEASVPDPFLEGLLGGRRYDD